MTTAAGPEPCSVWVGGSDRTGEAARLALVRESGEIRRIDLPGDLMRVEAVASVGTTTWLATTVTGGGGRVFRADGAKAPFRVVATVPAPQTFLTLCAGGSGHAAAIVSDGTSASTSLLLLPEKRTISRGARLLHRCAYDGETLVAAGVAAHRLVVDAVTGGKVREVPVSTVNVTRVITLTPTSGGQVFVGGDDEQASGNASLVARLVDVPRGLLAPVPLDAPALTSSARLANGHLLVTVGRGDGGLRTVELDGSAVVGTHDVPNHDDLLAADPAIAVAW